MGSLYTGDGTDHGIGALSYFMLADKIEIFTKYHFSNTFQHIYIDDFKDGIICKDTEKSLFPKLESAEQINSPWDLNHGTCIRFHLNPPLSFKKLLEFLSVNIIRIPYKIILKYNNNEYCIPHIWHFRKNIDKYAYKSSGSYYYNQFLSNEELNQKNEKVNSEIFNDLYKEVYDFYGENPPKDKSIHDNNINHDYFKGKININYWNENFIPCRISQNGILIRDSIEFILKNRTNDLITNAFGFDIDIKDNYCFQLDAERTTIINSKYNIEIFQKIESFIIEKYFEQISKIQSSLYFRCGGSFYHGITDSVFEHNNSLKCFNENLKKIFDNKKYFSYKKYHSCFNSAKLYMTGISRCNPVSVNDLKNESNHYILILKNNFSDKGLRRRNREPYVDTDKFLNKIEFQIDNNTVYLSDRNNSFILPLLNNFKFSKENENNVAILYKLRIEKNPDNSIIENELNTLWKNKI